MSDSKVHDGLHPTLDGACNMAADHMANVADAQLAKALDVLTPMGALELLLTELASLRKDLDEVYPHPTLVKPFIPRVEQLELIAKSATEAEYLRTGWGDGGNRLRDILRKHQNQPDLAYLGSFYRELTPIPFEAGMPLPLEPIIMGDSDLTARFGLGGILGQNMADIAADQAKDMSDNPRRIDLRFAVSGLQPKTFMPLSSAIMEARDESALAAVVRNEEDLNPTDLKIIAAMGHSGPAVDEAIKDVTFQLTATRGSEDVLKD